MAGRILCTVLLVSMVFASPAHPQERPFSLVLKGNVTTASRLFPYPKSSDIFERGVYFALEEFFGFGAEIRYRFPETNLALGLSSDYIHTANTQFVQFGSIVAPLKVGYHVIPVELTGYFIIPLSGRAFGVFMGGGIGAYFGEQVYKLGDTEAPTTDAGRGFGIHVLGGVSYRFTEWFSLCAEMKFRDLQFQTTNQFTAPTITYNGTVVSSPVAPLDAKVYTDGVVFQLGTAFSF